MQSNELDWNKLSSYSEEEALIMEAEEEILEQMDVLDAILKAFEDEENEDED